MNRYFKKVILALVNLIKKTKKKKRIERLELTFDRKFLNQAVIFSKLFPFSEKVLDLKRELPSESLVSL